MLPKPRSGHTATLINGGVQLLVFGGCGANSDFLSDVHVLHLPSMHWDQPKCVVCSKPLYIYSTSKLSTISTLSSTPSSSTLHLPLLISLIAREWNLNQDLGIHVRKLEISCTFFLVQDLVTFSPVSTKTTRVLLHNL